MGLSIEDMIEFVEKNIKSIDKQIDKAKTFDKDSVLCVERLRERNYYFNMILVNLKSQIGN